MIIPFGFLKKEDSTPINNYVFNADNDAYFSTDFDYNGLDDISFVVYGKLTNPGVRNDYFIGTQDDTSYGGYLFNATNDRFNGRLRNVGGTAATGYLAWTPDTDWHQFVMTYDGSFMNVYIDGVKDATTISTFTGFTTSYFMTLGGVTDGAYNSYSEMNIVKIYNRALTDTEVQTDLIVDINSVTSGLIVDFNEDKTLTIWTDNVSGYEATNQGGVITN